MAANVTPKAVQLELEKAYDATISGWIRALSLKDHETAGHSERVAQMAVFLATELGVPEKDLNDIRRGALLHDIGKLAVPDAILQKQGPLTEAEYMIVRQHIQYAKEMLAPIEFLKPVVEIISNHHERWDGLGYPKALKGDEIPLAAQVVSIAGVFDALRSDRPFRKAFSEKEAVRFIREESGKMFNPQVVSAFLHIIESSVLP